MQGGLPIKQSKEKLGGQDIRCTKAMAIPPEPAKKAIANGN